jgi:membrane protease YdiL (CAAX protease family)
MVGTRDREAVLNAVWHTPMLAYGTVPWYDFLGIFALGIIFTWLYNSAGASVLIAMIALFSNVMTVTMRPLFSPADQECYWLIMVVVECLTALAVLIATRGRLGLKPATNVP